MHLHAEQGGATTVQALQTFSYGLGDVHRCDPGQPTLMGYKLKLKQTYQCTLICSDPCSERLTWDDLALDICHHISKRLWQLGCLPGQGAPQVARQHVWAHSLALHITVGGAGHKGAKVQRYTMISIDTHVFVPNPGVSPTIVFILTFDRPTTLEVTRKMMCLACKQGAAGSNKTCS